MIRNAKIVVEKMLGSLIDRADGHSYCRCPGESLHTSPNAERDCRVYFHSGAPTIYCLHSSCAGAVDAANRLLRSALGKVERGVSISLHKSARSAEEFAREREKGRATKLANDAQRALANILHTYSWPAAEIWEDSPWRLADDPCDDWRLLLSLYQPKDYLWIGDKRDTGELRHKTYFRTAQTWLSTSRCPKGPLICPAILREGCWSRSKGNVERLPFLVVESDTLGKGEIGAVFRWLHECVGMKLVAVVDTASRSLHGWFIRPDEGLMRDLKTALPAMGCDGAVLRETQPVRLPGCQRPGKEAIQALLYLNREVLQ